MSGVTSNCRECAKEHECSIKSMAFKLVTTGVANVSDDELERMADCINQKCKDFEDKEDAITRCNVCGSHCGLLWTSGKIVAKYCPECKEYYGP